MEMTEKYKCHDICLRWRAGQPENENGHLRSDTEGTSQINLISLQPVPMNILIC